jgi:hypothetical protein
VICEVAKRSYPSVERRTRGTISTYSGIRGSKKQRQKLFKILKRENVKHVALGHNPRSHVKRGVEEELAPLVRISPFRKSKVGRMKEVSFKNIETRSLDSRNGSRPSIAGEIWTTGCGIGSTFH